MKSKFMVFPLGITTWMTSDEKFEIRFLRYLLNYFLLFIMIVIQE